MAKVLGVITARGGSKGIPRKNIKPFLGKPLIAYTIEAAKASGVFDRLILSTDDPKIVEVAKKCGAVVSVEEHQVKGGLGGAIAECLAKNHPTPMEFIGMQDTFGESGPPTALVEKYGMGVKDVKAAVKKVLRRKR